MGEVGFIPELNPLFALLFRLAAICDPTYVTLGRWFVLKIPRGDTNGVGEDEVTLTSWLHAQAERTKEQKREEKATGTSGGGPDKDPKPGDAT